MLPALVDALDLVTDLALLGLVGGRDELLSQLLQVSLVLTEQVDLLHAVLHRQVKGKKDTNSASFNSKHLDWIQQKPCSPVSKNKRNTSKKIRNPSFMWCHYVVRFHISQYSGF